MRSLGMVLALMFAAGCSRGSSTGPAPSASSPSSVPAASEHSSKAPVVSGKGTVTTARFYSQALGVEKQYYVYLPGGYESSQARYPVIYMLHGIGGSESNWTENMGLTKAADAMGLPAIVVMPDGDDSFYVNWVSEVNYADCLQGTRPIGRTRDMSTYCVKQPRYEDYIVKDLIAHVDTTYRTIAKREARAIGGLSMGGYGALVLGFRNRALFAATASHSGVNSLIYIGPFPYERGKAQLAEDPRKRLQDNAIGKQMATVYGYDIARWREHDPTTLAMSLSDGDIAIYMDCGTEDEFRLHNHMQYLHEVLENRGIKHRFHLLAGKHDAAFWKDRIDDSLQFHMQVFNDNRVWDLATTP